MSLRIETEAAGVQTARSAEDLPVGTWFTDETAEVYVTVMDDHDEAKKVVCLGKMQRPFICAAAAVQFTRLSILPLGTALKIVDSEAA